MRWARPKPARAIYFGLRAVSTKLTQTIIIAKARKARDYGENAAPFVTLQRGVLAQRAGQARVPPGPSFNFGPRGRNCSTGQQATKDLSGRVR